MDVDTKLRSTAGHGSQITNNIIIIIIIIIYSIYRALIPNGPKALCIIKMTKS